LAVAVSVNCEDSIAERGGRIGKQVVLLWWQIWTDSETGQDSQDYWMILDLEFLHGFLSRDCRGL
jgi:hypothetical protein